MHERHYRKIVSILEQRHRRRYVWLAHALLMVIFVNFFLDSIRFFSWHHHSSVAGVWLALVCLHLIYVVIREMRGRMTIQQIEASYGWDNAGEKRKPLYLEDDGELVNFEEPIDEKLKRSY